MVPLARLTSVYGEFRAHVVAARLESEGFDVELRGAVGSPYGLTVGDLARVDLYVPSDQVDQACVVLLATEVDDALEPAEPRPRRRVPARWVVLAATVVVVGAPVAHQLAPRL